MIRSLRKIHKLIWVALAILLPILVISGLMFRHSEPLNEEIPMIERGIE